MATLSATEARKKLYRLIDETSLTHEPITITGKRGNAVLLSESDYCDRLCRHQNAIPVDEGAH